MIRKAVIERIREDVANCSDDALEREFDRFFADQPELCSFVMDVTAPGRQRIRELALYLSYVVYRAVAEATTPPAMVAPERIAAAAAASQRWVQRVGELDAAAFDQATAEAARSEPYLLGYVVTELEDAIDDGFEMADEEKGMIFFVMKTVIALLAGPA